MAIKVNLKVNRDYVVGEVDPRLFGGFIEHMGRGVYTGIYEPGHPTADEDGFRGDVLEYVRKLDMPIMRYPGGNFVSSYNWRDGIGPKEKRPVRLDGAWQAKEPNQFGVDEFIRWCRKAGTAPMMAVNLGTGSPKDAQDLVEYCNFPSGTYWSDLRRSNGAEEPHGVKVWCLGNEMDGSWQSGHKSAGEYGALARESAKMMKQVDPSIQVVLCGSSSWQMGTFCQWDAQALEKAFYEVDFISVHSYFSLREGDPLRRKFFASPEMLDQQLDGVIAACDYISAKYKSPKRINLSLDEWNVWYRTRGVPNNQHLWEVARPLLEEQYNAGDALVVGGLMLSMLDHVERLKMGCLAQVCNVIAPIMTRPGGGAWLQSIFHPIYYTSKYGRGTVLRMVTDSPVYSAPECLRPVPWVRSTAVYNPAAGEVTLFAINRSMEEHGEITMDLENFQVESVLQAVELHHPDITAANSEEEPNKVTAVAMEPKDYRLEGARLLATLKSASWNMLRIKVGK